MVLYWKYQHNNTWEERILSSRVLYHICVQLPSWSWADFNSLKSVGCALLQITPLCLPCFWQSLTCLQHVLVICCAHQFAGLLLLCSQENLFQWVQRGLKGKTLKWIPFLSVVLWIFYLQPLSYVLFILPGCWYTKSAVTQKCTSNRPTAIPYPENSREQLWYTQS